MLLWNAKLQRENHPLQPIFKVAIFFSATTPAEASLFMENGALKPFEGDQGTMIHISTAHIWGRNDVLWRKSSEDVARMCFSEKRSIFVHDGFHEIPGGGDKSTIIETVHTIRRAIDAAMTTA